MSSKLDPVFDALFEIDVVGGLKRLLMLFLLFGAVCFGAGFLIARYII
jgi:hypothetical protein